MKLLIELYAGANRAEPTVRDVQKNIDALQRAIDGKPRAMDFVLLIATKSILTGIQERIARGNYR